jgi:hypothetical protein
MYKKNERKSYNLVKSDELICHFITLYLVPQPPFLIPFLSFQVDQISGKIEGQFLIPHARSDPRDLTQLHKKVDAGPALMNPTSRFEYDGPEGNGSWRELQPLSLTGENVMIHF